MQAVDILAIAAHPDDVELACSGTLLKHIDQGYTVGILDLTRGELGTRGSAEIRANEAAEAARLMGATFRHNVGLADGFFPYSEESIRRIIPVIRTARPRIVLANSLSDRHPDHGRAAKLIADACYYSGLAKIETTDEHGRAQEHWRPHAIYHYIQDHNLTPDFVVDISPYLEKKMELIMAFGSQFYNPEASEYAEELESPISSKSFFDYLTAKAAAYGRIANYDFAEGFNVARTPGVRNLFDLD
ncbi:MAG: bacillithiol biosynthesis deacetylase BshB1 [Lewinella sp.]|nr:bacillithiol biosynthesis deacetylase BshB1 [Lewinella sp.]